MARQSTEQSNALHISWLKKQGALSGGFSSGGITWTSVGGDKSSIGYSIEIGENENSIILRYTQTDRWSGEKSDLDYKIQLVSTPCNYGGKRYWFICPLSKNGKYCGRRVGVLYLIGKYYGCRHCGNIAYQAQSEGKRFRSFASCCAPDVDKAEAEAKRPYYNGKMTRKYKRFLSKERKLEMALIMTTEGLHATKQIKIRR